MGRLVHCHGTCNHMEDFKESVATAFRNAIWRGYPKQMIEKSLATLPLPKVARGGIVFLFIIFIFVISFLLFTSGGNSPEIQTSAINAQKNQRHTSQWGCLLAIADSGAFRIAQMAAAHSRTPSVRFAQGGKGTSEDATSGVESMVSVRVGL